MSQNPIFSSKISLFIELPVNMNFQGGKSLQRTFSLSPVSEFFSKKFQFFLSKISYFFQILYLEWTAVSEDANDNFSFHSKYDRLVSWHFSKWAVFMCLSGFRHHYFGSSILVIFTQIYRPLLPLTVHFRPAFYKLTPISRWFCSESCKRKSKTSKKFDKIIDKRIGRGWYTSMVATFAKPSYATCRTSR